MTGTEVESGADPDIDPMARVARDHLTRRTIVLEEHRLLYLPVPKTAWTAMLWGLAELAGLDSADFAASVKPEISTSMSVHDEDVWGQNRRLLRTFDDGAARDVLAAADWMRFSVVRDPARRLWSAWQSKFLLREPVYFGFHSTKPWYPQRPTDPAAVVEDFRAFVRALVDGFGDDSKMRDPHWGRQSDITALLPLNHIGRVERLDETEAAIRAHLGATAAFTLPHENVMPLPYSPALFDAETARLVAEVYAPDFAAFDYAPPEPLGAADQLEQAERWAGVARAQFPHMGELVERHERLYAVVTEFRGRSRTTQGENRDLKARLRAAENDLRGTRERLAAASRELRGARRRYDEIRASTSWRLTAPVRRLGALGKR